jgi:hypothetical protein
LIGAEGTRLLRDREVTGDPAGAKATPLKKSFSANNEISCKLKSQKIAFFTIKVGRGKGFSSIFQSIVGMVFSGNHLLQNILDFFSGLRQSAEEAPGPPRGKRVTGAEINRPIYRDHQ